VCERSAHEPVKSQGYVEAIEQPPKLANMLVRP
jgi:hypothetical protein